MSSESNVKKSPNFQNGRRRPSWIWCRSAKTYYQNGVNFCFCILEPLSYVLWENQLYTFFSGSSLILLDYIFYRTSNQFFSNKLHFYVLKNTQKFERNTSTGFRTSSYTHNEIFFCFTIGRYPFSFIQKHNGKDFVHKLKSFWHPYLYNTK